VGFFHPPTEPTTPGSFQVLIQPSIGTALIANPNPLPTPVNETLEEAIYARQFQ
jgi:hypothetical protein